MLTLYGIKNCDTVKKAIKWLDANHKKYIFLTINKKISRSKLENFISKIEKERLINKKESYMENLPNLISKVKLQALG